MPDTPPLAAIYIVKPGDPPQSWKLRLSDPDRRDVRARITYLLASGAELVRDWVTVDDGMVVVPDPLSARLRLRVFAQLDAATLVEAVVALNYVDAANDYRSERQLIFTPTALAPQAVEIPIFADGPRTLSYELSIVKTNGQVVTRTLDGVSGPVIMISEG
ncbi:MAG: hypothetical protein IPO67_29225 [Deltaproteobacteria bacterium]|nr:hypothetical protein [Deltaproteobacteria bacterium]